MSTVSVIIPCFNAEKTIRRTVNSVLRQTCRDLEIILVNDSSTDGTGTVLSQLAETDARIRVIHHDKNLGEGAARFTGVHATRCRYLCFLDADDTLTQDAIATLLSVAETEDADIVEGAHTRILGNLGLVRERHHVKNRILGAPELMDDFFISFFGVNILSVNAWGKLYKRDLFERSAIGPTGFKRGEDLVMNMQLFPFVRKYVSIDKDIVHYYYGGVTASLDPSFYDCSKKQYYLKLEMIDHYGYAKARRTTGIEMCNILNTTVQQMLLANWPHAAIRGFLEREASSGFLREIASLAGECAKFVPIKNMDPDEIIESQRSGLRKARLRRTVSNLIARCL